MIRIRTSNEEYIIAPENEEEKFSLIVCQELTTSENKKNEMESKLKN